MAIFPSSAIPSAAEDYTIDYSCRFNQAAPDWLSKTFGSAGNRKTWTFSCWYKPGLVDTSSKVILSAGTSVFEYRLAGKYLQIWNGTTSPNNVVFTTLMTLWDPASWYHFVLAIDTSQATDTNRVKVYVNGVQPDLKPADTNYPDQDTEWQVNNNVEHNVGRFVHSSPEAFDGYLADVHFIDGQQLTPSDFGETNSDTNQWVPIKYGGSYGSNGFYFKFQDSSALGDDSSGNTNDFAMNGLAAQDQMLDTPTNNFCTWNPVYRDGYDNDSVYTEGNLAWATTGSGDGLGDGTIGVASGKWYWEYYINTIAGDNGYFGAHQVSGHQFTNHAYYCTDRGVINATGETQQTGVGAASAGDKISCALDMDATPATLKIYKNNSLLGTAIDLVAGVTYSPFTGTGNGVVKKFTLNCGQDSSFAGAATAGGNTDANDIGDFFYTVPANHLALCTSNLPEPAIVLPEPHFEILTATGDGTASKTYSGLEFQPDFVWAKDYDGTYDDGDHQFMDVIRGADQILRCNDNSASLDGSDNFGGGSLRTFTSDGFTVEEGTSTNNNLNGSGDSIIAYNWKAGGTGVTNNEGSITGATVSANTTSGFAIVTFTSNQTAGATVGHGLTQAPEMIWSKRTDGAQSWYSGATSMADTTPWGWAWEVNHHNAWSNRDEEWDDTTPGASVFTLGQYGSNVGANPAVCYCFHGVEGYSKIGHYIGNGNADGPFIYTGFSPSFVIFKGNGSNLHNHMLDNKRWTYNPVGVTTGPEPGLAMDDGEVPSGEGTGDVDFLSNGFKIRSDNGNANDNTTRFIYIAFAKSPFKYSNAR